MSTGLLHALCNPKRTNGVRMPRPGSPSMTSVLSMNVPVTSALLTKDPGTRYMLCNNPMFPLWADTDQSWMHAYRLNIILSRMPSGSEQAVFSLADFAPVVSGSQTLGVNTLLLRPAAALGPPFQGVAGNVGYTYVPAGAAFILFLATGSGQAMPSMAADLLCYTPGSGTSYSYEVDLSLSGSLGYAVFAFPTAQWVRPGRCRTQAGFVGDSLHALVACANAIGFEVTNTAVNSFSVAPTYTPSTTVEVLIPLVIAGVSAAPSVCNSARLVSSRLDVSNVTKVLSKEGTLHAGLIVGDGDCWNWGVSHLTALHPRLRCSQPMEKPLSAVYVPAGVDTGFRDYYNGLCPVVFLDRMDSFLAVVAYDPDVATQTSLLMSFSWQFEFQNASQLWPVGFTPYSSVDVETALRRLAVIGYAGPPSIYAGLGGTGLSSSPDAESRRARTRKKKKKTVSQKLQKSDASVAPKTKNGKASVPPGNKR